MLALRPLLVNLALLLAIPAAGLLAIAILTHSAPDMVVAIDYITTSSIP